MNGIHSGLSLKLALSSVDEIVFKMLSPGCYPSLSGLADKGFPLYSWRKVGRKE